MIYPEVYSIAFAELRAQKFTIHRTTVDARIENNKKEVSEWENETAQKLLNMYSAGLTKYRHLVFDSAESVYAWNGLGFIPVDVIQDTLFFYDDWSEHIYSTSEEIRSAVDLLCWQLDRFAGQLSPGKRLKSLWVIGTEDTLPIEKAIELAVVKDYEIKDGQGLVSASLEMYRKLPNENTRQYLLTHGVYECSNLLQRARIKVAQTN